MFFNNPGPKQDLKAADRDPSSYRIVPRPDSDDGSSVLDSTRQRFGDSYCGMLFIHGSCRDPPLVVARKGGGMTLRVGRGRRHGAT